ncbi:MAG TPA: lysine--tRNA ligase [Planctomycetota bacterium]|nr:lysine--tRNA ligase [Planctomycetota bacterium]
MTEIAQSDRLAKLETLRAAGIDPYPPRGVDGTPIDQVLAGMGSPEAPGPMCGKVLWVAGRVLSLRDFGKLIFCPVLDRTGRIQVGLQRDALADFWPMRKTLDAGDLVGIRGELGFTQKGEPTVWAQEVRLLAKSVAAPPQKWHGLTDKETRYRRRYVDLWASDEVMRVFLQRSQILSSIRRFLEARGYLEVETPTLHPIMGGATARPFITHHNALDTDLYLRVAPELYLKRLIVGGMERVFEIARNFRNEGLSVRHNPEFTMLELYQAHADYHHMMEITETMISSLAMELYGRTQITWRGKEFDLKAPFERRTYADAFQSANGCAFDDEPAVRARAKELGLHDHGDYWKLMNDVFEATAEKDLIGPLFLCDYPIQICPLAKRSTSDPRLAERFEIFLDGMELGNAFTELNDPADQQERFQAQVDSKDPESPAEVDIDYVQALEYGMPPAGGLGIGIDRLVMVLTGQDSIRDVLLFPAMRKLAPGGNEVHEVESPAEA